MKTIILAGGRGTRLPDSAKDKPKCLVEVNGKPILQHQLEFLAQHGIHDVRLSLGFRADQVIEYLKNVSRETFHIVDYVIEDKPLGTGGAIKFASQDLYDDFMVLNGDVFVNTDLREFIGNHRNLTEKHGILGSILAIHCPDCRDFGLIHHENGLIKEFSEKPKELVPGHINAGIYILSPKIWQNVSRETFSVEHDVFPELARKNKLGVHLAQGYWTDLGTEERLKKAKEV